MSLISGNENKIFARGEIGIERKAQEDSHGLRLGTPNGDLFVVCDGMGGHVGGAKASSIAVESIINRISEEKRPTLIDALNDALQFANMQILGFANDHYEFKGMGTTACILLLQDDGAWIAHVGILARRNNCTALLRIIHTCRHLLTKESSLTNKRRLIPIRTAS